MNRYPSSIIAVAFSLAAIGQSYAATPELKMYRLDCGYMRLGDKSMMSDSGPNKGQSYDIVVSCYLIKHGGDWLLWDAGLPKKYLPGPLVEGSLTTGLNRTIVDQLHDLGLTPDDIKYVAVSHAHSDHAGQVNGFPNATLIIQRKELEALADTKTASEHFIAADLFSTHVEGRNLKKVMVIDGDVDLFADGTSEHHPDAWPHTGER
ncbi:MBL fold metallo-hydrolase [Pseudomonas sp. S2_H01]